MRGLHAGGLLVAAALLALPGGVQAQTDDGAERDRGILTRFLEDRLSDAGREVQIIGFEGALSSRATIDTLTIADSEGVWITLRGAVLDWNRSALFGGRLEVNELAAEEIVLERAPILDDGGIDPPSPEARPFRLPDLPISVRIGAIAAERVVLGEALLGEEAVVTLTGSAALAGGEGVADLSIRRIDAGEGALTLAGQFDNETRVLALDLTLDEGPGGIAARLLGLRGMPAVRLGISGEGPLRDFAADILLATDGEERLGGTVTLRGEGEAAQAFEAALEGDLRPILPPDLHPFFGPSASLAAEGLRPAEGGFDLSSLRIATQAVQLTGALRIGPDGLPTFFRLTGDLGDASGAPVPLPFGGGERPTIGRASLRLGFDAAEGPDWRLEGVAESVETPGLRIDSLSLDGAGQITGAGGSGETRGVSGAVAFTAQGVAPDDPALAEAVGPRLSGRLEARWSEGAPLLLSDLRLEAQGLRIAGEGRIEGTTLDGQVMVTAPDVARFSALADRPLSGSLRGEVAGEVEPLSGAFDLQARLSANDLRIGQPEVDNLLAGQAQIGANIRRDETGTTLRLLNVTARTLRLEARGTISSSQTGLDASLVFSDLSVLGPEYGGAMRATAELSGPPEALRLSATATGSDLRVGDPRANALLAGRSELALDALRSGDGTLTVERFTANAQTLDFGAAGVVGPTDTDLSARLDVSDLGVLGPGYGGSVALEAQVGQDGSARTIVLTGDATGLRIGQAAVDPLLRGRTALRIDARQDGDRIRVEDFQLTNPQLSATADATADGETRRVTIDARINDMGIVAPGLSGPLRVGGTIDEAGGAFIIDLRAEGPANTDIAAAGRVTPNLVANVALTGQTDLALISSFLDDISVQGPVRLDLRLLGQPGLSALGGTARLTGGRIIVPRQYVTLEDLNATATFGQGRVTLDLTGRSARGGTLRVAGPIRLASGFPADLSLRVNDFAIVDPELYSTAVTGELGITGQLVRGQPRVAGALRLGQTEVRIPDAGFARGAYVPPNVRHIAEPEDARLTRVWARVPDASGDGERRNTPLALNIELSAPNRIFIRGRGLDAEVGGSLVLRGTTANVVPAGEFGLIRGRLDILGNRFTLTEGYASLQGRFIPYVRLAATTEADGITATVILEGVATEPRIRFTSSPELPEEEVVSRLLFGRDLGSLSAFQAAQLASAVATLSGRGGNGIVNRLRENFGLDDLDITTDEDGTASVRAGAYIAENVYTDLRVDAEGRSQVTINLDVTPSLTLRGSAGSDGQSGIGIFFERDY